MPKKAKKGWINELSDVERTALADFVLQCELDGFIVSMEVIENYCRHVLGKKFKIK